MCEPILQPNDLGFLTQEQLADMHLHATSIMRRVREEVLNGDTDAAAEIMDSVCHDYEMTYLVWRRRDGQYDTLPLRGWDHAREVHTSGTSATVHISCYDPGNARAAKAHAQVFENHPDARWVVDPISRTARSRAIRIKMRPVARRG